MEEENAITEIPWMIDMTALDASLDENQSVTFKEGVHFDFNDDISLMMVFAINIDFIVTKEKIFFRKKSATKQEVNSFNNIQHLLQNPNFPSFGFSKHPHELFLFDAKTNPKSA